MTSPVRLTELSHFIICPICQGYLIEATTVSECLHTFCKSCIVKHIKNNHNECPQCNTTIHERRPLDYVIHDRNKQDIVYKLVPQLYITELKKRASAKETRDEIDTITRLILKKKFLPLILIQKSIEPHKTLSSSSSSTLPTPPTIHLRCPVNIKIRQIRRLLIAKFQLGADDKITLLHKGDIVSDEDQVSNLAQSLTFCLNYEISKISHRRRVGEVETVKMEIQ